MSQSGTVEQPLITPANKVMLVKPPIQCRPQQVELVHSQVLNSYRFPNFSCNVLNKTASPSIILVRYVMDGLETFSTQERGRSGVQSGDVVGRGNPQKPGHVKGEAIAAGRAFL
jgi:hypothetical protein